MHHTEMATGIKQQLAELVGPALTRHRTNRIEDQEGQSEGMLSSITSVVENRSVYYN
jgi:hypothetical protein